MASTEATGANLITLSPDRELELKVTLSKLGSIVEKFHGEVKGLGVHGFSETVGLLNGLIRIYERTLSEGIDFASAGEDSNVPLVALPSSLDFIQQKMDSILSPFGSVKVTPRA